MTVESVTPYKLMLYKHSAKDRLNQSGTWIVELQRESFTIGLLKRA